MLGLAMALVGPPTAARAAPSGDPATTVAPMGAISHVVVYNWATSRCVDIPGSGVGRPLGPVLLWDCTPNDNQYFTFVQRAPGMWWLSNDTDGHCVDLPGTSTVSAGTSVVEYYCADRDNQYWSPRFRFSVNIDNALIDRQRPCSARPDNSPCFDFYWLRNFYWNGSSYVDSGQCLDVPGPANGGNGARLGVYYCTDFDDNDWTWF
jgi:hypothetical protein